MSRGALYPDLSPGLARTGRAAVWTEHEGRLLMAYQGPHHTLPGGGIEPGETAEEAAVREAWEECGAVVELTGSPFQLSGHVGNLTTCFPARLIRMEPSPEGRPHLWVDPLRLPWCGDEQIRQGLAALDCTPGFLSVPSLVAAAGSRANQNGFDRSSSAAVGRLLRQLTAMRPAGRFLELGSGFGVGTGWMLSGMDALSRLSTAELDPGRARAVAELHGHDARLHVHTGNGWPLLAGGPYDLIFADCAASKGEGEYLDALMDALKPGGTLIMDNFTPHDRLQGELAQRLAAGDPLRMALHTHPRLYAHELRVSDGEAVLLATRTA